ncbi:MAG: hypothetical protein JW861_10745 [Bacteroidales bacterium]|nr:hypothetical protein [Bacteroidales bacterium]
MKPGLLLVVSVCLSSGILGQGRLREYRPGEETDVSEMPECLAENIGNGHPGIYPLRARMGYEAYYAGKPTQAFAEFPVLYDLRTAGPGGTPLVTPVKSQMGCGACWAFATYGSMESGLLAAGMGEYDFSENNLKNCHGFEPLPCQWGHHFMSTAYLTRRSGPIAESDDPYVPVNGACTPGFVPVFYITDARYPPDDLMALKQAIYSYGGLYTTMAFRLECYNPLDYTYCDTISVNTGHAVTLAGWDDNKVVTGGPLSPPDGRIGAFIVKNSRGLTFGENGYFYVAYDDNLIKKYCAYWPGVSLYDSSVHIYQYDTIGGWPFIGYDDTIAFGMVKFDSPADHLLTSVGTYTVAYGSTLEVTVYDDFDGITASGVLGSAALSCSDPGYYTIPLQYPVPIPEGEDFFILIKYMAPGFDFPIAVEGVDPGYSNPLLETGKCWASPDGMAWEVLGNGTPYPYDLCIKVHAVEFLEADLRVFLEGPFDGTGMSTFLNDQNLLPMCQPYSQFPWNYQGTECATAMPVNTVDWVLLDLRDAPGGPATATSGTRIAMQAALLLDNGAIRSADGSSFPLFRTKVTDSLYVVIHHRNHLAVMSSMSLQKVNGRYSYDFTDGIHKAYGGMIGFKQLLPGKTGMAGGDGDANGLVDNVDKIDVWTLQAGGTGYLQGDFSMDTQVSNSDKNEIWVPNSGMGSQVPGR